MGTSVSQSVSRRNVCLTPLMTTAGGLMGVERMKEAFLNTLEREDILEESAGGKGTWNGDAPQPN